MLAGKKRERNIDSMKKRRKGGKHQPEDDSFDRSRPGTLASLIDQWSQRLAERNYFERTPDTTSIHTQVVITHLKEIYARTHPAAVENQS